jgi:hypothetical protein
VLRSFAGSRAKVLAAYQADPPWLSGVQVLYISEDRREVAIEIKDSALGRTVRKVDFLLLQT